MSLYLTPIGITGVLILWFGAVILSYRLLHEKPGKLEFLFVGFIVLVCICGTLALTAHPQHDDHMPHHYAHEYIEANSP